MYQHITIHLPGPAKAIVALYSKYYIAVTTTTTH